MGMTDEIAVWIFPTVAFFWKAGLIGNPDPSAADGVKQAVDGISVVFTESV
jgi:hypothetical protein